MRLRYRRAVSPADARFPGHAKWRRHLRVQQERITAPLRAASAAAGGLIWVLSPRPPGGIFARDILLSAVVYSAALFAAVRVRPQWASRAHFAVPLLDFLLVSLWVLATGGPRSIFAPTFFLGSASVAVLLPGGEGIAFAIAYAVAYAVIVHPPAMFGPIALLLSGVGLSTWSAVVERDRIAHLRDPLTGSFSRTYGLFHLGALLRARALPFSIGLVDLDLFKQINDAHGHAAGDRALRECVRLLQVHLRPDDLLVRLGGDEFLVVWPGLDASEAHLSAERLRSAAADLSLPVTTAPDPLRLTISIGVAEARRGMRTGDVLSAADRSLYRAKQDRNRVARS